MLKNEWVIWVVKHEKSAEVYYHITMISAIEIFRVKFFDKTFANQQRQSYNRHHLTHLER